MTPLLREKRVKRLHPESTRKTYDQRGSLSRYRSPLRWTGDGTVTGPSPEHPVLMTSTLTLGRGKRKEGARVGTVLFTVFCTFTVSETTGGIGGFFLR